MRRRRHAVTAVALLAGVLTGCGSDDGAESAAGGGVAAVVDGREIGVGELQQATRELNEALTRQGQTQQLAPGEVLNSVIAEPTLAEAGRESGAQIPSDETISTTIGAQSPPSELAVDFVRASTIFSQLDPARAQAALQSIAGGDVEVSPRYALPDGVLPQEPPNWLVPQQPQPQQPAPAQPQQQQPQQPAPAQPQQPAPPTPAG